MKHFKIVKILALLAVAFSAFPVHAQQNTLTQTSLSQAITANQTQFSIASATNISVNTLLYVDLESMRVRTISGTTVTVTRGADGTAAVSHANAAMVLAGNANWFYKTDPTGSCVAASTYVTPWVNISTGRQWLCSTVTLDWVPGFGNLFAQAKATAAVASANGLVTPSGPLFHITGTNAITGFNIPVGFNKGVFCVIPDAIFTTTNATNIALASTAVVSRTLCYNYDGNAAKPFFPSY